MSDQKQWFLIQGKFRQMNIVDDIKYVICKHEIGKHTIKFVREKDKGDILLQTSRHQI